MEKKIYPNELCPCGSGKKYKHCCGNGKNNKFNTNYPRYDMQQADFVKKNIDRDWLFLSNVLQLVIGPKGYLFCKENMEKLAGDYTSMLSFLRKAINDDKLGVYKKTEENPDNEHLSNISAYGRMFMYEDGNDDISRAEEDFVTLAKRGVIYKYQIILFHLYILDNIRRRFDDYFYAPSDNWLEGQHYGVLAHRGYDYLIGMSLYLELQLGVHLYDIGFVYSKAMKKEYINDYFGGIVDPEDVTDNMCVFIDLYMNTIDDALKNYNPHSELDFYKSIKALNDQDYSSRIKILDSSDKSMQKCNYKEYLKYMVGATCFNLPNLYFVARLAHPECDFLKMIVGIESVHDVFEKTPKLTPEVQKAAEEVNYNVYHETVFLMMDELYGSSFGLMQAGHLEYIDPTEMVFQEEQVFVDSETSKIRAYNPAAKSTSMEKYKVRHLRMELYNLLSGKAIMLLMSADPNKPIKDNTVIVAGNYLVIPWLSNGKEKTVHTKPFDGEGHDLKDLYSEDIQTRKSYLNMEYRLTEIPINCIEEYLNPSIYYNWLKIKQQNAELQEANNNLKKQMKINHDLVRNIAHSAVNYLNSERLANTGVALHGAQDDNPTLEKLHSDGLLLMLQSEQEEYLTRQLKDAVRKYQSDMSEEEKKAKEVILEDRIRGSISKSDGISVEEVFGFALRTVIARILFRTKDEKGQYIRNKLNRSESDWTNMTSTFMTDVLAGDKGNTAFEWWVKNWNAIDLKVSDIWKKIKFSKNGEFYDLILEITTEFMINALVHGEIQSGINIEFGQENNEKGRPLWAFISSMNKIGDTCEIKSGVGLSSLNNDILLLNHGERAVAHDMKGEFYETKTWLNKKLLVTK